MNYESDLKKLAELSRQAKRTLDTGMDFWGYIGDLDVQVAYDYSPPQEPTRTDPGFDAEVEVIIVMWNGVDLLDGINADTSHKRPEGERDKPSYLEDIEDQCREHWVAVNVER